MPTTSWWLRRVAVVLVACAWMASAPAGAASARATFPIPDQTPLDLVFADGFESGDVCGWSAAVPPAGTTWYLDADQDGFGDPGTTTVACTAPAGFVANGDDCDDSSADTFPGAAPLDSPSACMLDADGDDYGSDAPPAGVTPGTDCDDGQGFAFPGAAPHDSPTACMQDADEDDYGSSAPPSGVTPGSDCDDTVATVHPGVPDDPDPLYLDSNCDGLDGDVARAAFAATTGVDAGSCTLASPCQTVGFAAATAAADPQRDQVYVQAGTYPEILELPDGVAIFGGYDVSWQRADRHVSGHTVTLQGGYSGALDAYLAVHADTVTASLADLFLQAPDATGGGASPLAYSSQVVQATQATLTFARVTFAQGDGETGAAGADGTAASQTPAATGGTGQDGASFSTPCDTTRPGGGSGGTNSCSSGVTNGGAGGAGGSMDTSCVAGTCGGPFGGDCNARPGLPGETGFNGGGTAGFGGAVCGGPTGQGGAVAPTDGSGGTGATAGGYLAADQWHARDGQAGGLGADGKGGGGGGGAGGCDTGTDSMGPGGGGGGAGGCRASAPGGGGKGGGGSFGIVAIGGSTIGVTDSEFLRGAAGTGGQGGQGALGQPGGGPGPGGLAAPNTSVGGSGGAGGRGGHSGGGGGGTGGRSCGILALASTVNESGNSYLGGQAGVPGPGGASPGNSGNAGADGTLGTLCTCTSASDC